MSYSRNLDNLSTQVSGIQDPILSETSKVQYNRVSCIDKTLKMKSHFNFGVVLIILAVGQAVEIDQGQTNQCICSDFTYLNEQGLLVSLNLQAVKSEI